ncbi:MAG: chromosomal replication initiator protein DnaA [Candidatus Pacebacteria bacterium]|nr:chromosomal replication initiator protein DnaA [Candidatus Paceibacterota bacterium]
MSESFYLSEEEVKQIWEQMCLDIKADVSEAVFATWILNNPLTKIELMGNDGATCTFTSPTAFHSNNFKKNLGGKLINTLNTLLGRKPSLNFSIGTPIRTNGPSSISQTLNHNDLKPNIEQNQQTPSQPQSNNISMPTQARAKSFQQIKDNVFGFNKQDNSGVPTSPRVEDLFGERNIQNMALDKAKVAAKQAGLRPDFTFEKFAVSGTNEMAHAAATAVSQKPGQAYNPLFLYGGVGVGKTHLMHATANNILKNRPETKVLYCTGEDFTNEIVDAIRTKKANRFKNKYRNVGVLLIDDIQFIAGKNAVQEEFFHTFNALTQQNSQIILTSDRPPHEINFLEARIKSRFEAGLIIDIGQPSFELRTAILLIKANAQHLIIPMNIAQLIASRVDSARKIEGVIKLLKSAVELQNKEINEELVNNILKTEETTHSKKLRVTPQDIIKAVSSHYHVKQTALKGDKRVKNLVTARHVAMYLMDSELNIPLVEIGRWFSGRDHTTVIHAKKKINRELLNNDLMQRDVSALKMSLSAISR